MQVHPSPTYTFAALISIFQERLSRPTPTINYTSSYSLGAHVDFSLLGSLVVFQFHSRLPWHSQVAVKGEGEGEEERPLCF